MRFSRVFAGVLGAVGAALAAATVWVSLHNMSAQPVLVRAPEAAVNTAQKLMACIAADDRAGAEKLFYGTPGLGEDLTDETSGLVWDAFVSSLTYSFPGKMYATESGVALDMHVRSLKLDSVTQPLKARTQALLDERVAQTEDQSLIYDDTGSYKTEFVMAVFEDAVRQALREDAEYEEKDLTMHLVFEDGAWWVLPETEIIRAISGETAG